MTVRVSVVLNRTLVDSDCCFDEMCASYFQSEPGDGGGGGVSCHLMVFNSDW